MYSTSQIATAFDKELAKHRELSKSKYYQHLKIFVVVDNNFDYLNHVVALWDVTVMRDRQLLYTPSLIAPGLAFFDSYWHENVGVLTLAQLESFLYYVEEYDNYAAAAKQGSTSMGQEVSITEERAGSKADMPCSHGT
jgi:hypothetical protein